MDTRAAAHAPPATRDGLTPGDSAPFDTTDAPGRGTAGLDASAPNVTVDEDHAGRASPRRCAPRHGSVSSIAFPFSVCRTAGSASVMVAPSEHFPNEAHVTVVSQWLAAFDATLATGDARAIAALLPDECYWRDVLALTWDIVTVAGRDTVAQRLAALPPGHRPRRLRVATGRTPPREVMRAGVTCVEAFYDFDLPDGRGHGVVRLVPDAASPTGWLGWTLLTALDALDHAAPPATLTEAPHLRDFRGPNWLDLRRVTQAYADRDPAVLVIGAGQAGLATAARLGALGIDTLVVDREARIGDNWRLRYHALTLHNQVQVNHLPLMPFPPTWPTYIPKDKLANWFEAYAEALELNVWTGTDFERAHYDTQAGHWIATLRLEDGTHRTMRPRHVVMATGASCVPFVPEIPTLGEFGGPVIHSSEYQTALPWRDRHVLVIGTGTSAHDIAQDLHGAGAHVTMAQRSPTLVVNLEPSAQLPYSLYDEGPPLEDCDLITMATPVPLAKRVHRVFTAQARDMDRPLLDALERRGFRLDFGEDGTGWQFKYLTRGGGYYFNVGCSELIADGHIGLVQFSDIATFVPEGVRMNDGRVLPADLVILATGYHGQEALVRRLLGDDVAAHVGPIWGFGEGLELRNMFVRTAQPGLWFIAGSLAQCRIYSKSIALQIQACETGRLSPTRAA